MGITLPEDLRLAIMDPSCVKILSTVNRYGDSHLSFNSSFNIRDDSFLEYYETLDYSLNSRNMYDAIWSSKVFMLNIRTPDLRDFKLALNPKKAIISGEEFREHREKARASGAGCEVSAIFVIAPLSFIELPVKRHETDGVRREPILFRLEPGRHHQC